MNVYAAAALLVVVAFLVGLVVLVLLEPFRIDRTGDRFDYGLTDDDAPRDDNDWPTPYAAARERAFWERNRCPLCPPENQPSDYRPPRHVGRPPRRINGDH